jgi:hypothetical protein
MFRIIFIFALWIGWFGHQSIRGMSVAPSISLMTDFIFKTDKMKGKKRTLEEVLFLFKEKHAKTFDYSLVTESTFRGMNYKIPIICRTHGVFYQTPHNHLLYGCPTCGKLRQGGGVHYKKRKKLYGVAFNDYSGSTSKHGRRLVSYSVWKYMITRCYSNREDYSSYKGCSVCEEWLYFSNFKKWFDENYIEGYHLDKDILVKGNKVYSPQTCCFVPPQINTLIIKHDTTRGELPIGVSQTKNKRYRANLRKFGEDTNLGCYNTPEEAFASYKTAKEAHIKEVAAIYFNEGKIRENVYKALIKYTVDIND